MKEEQLEQQRKRQLLVNNNTENVCNFNGHKVHSDNVKYEIVRAMEQQDSLLEILIQKQPSTSLTKTSSAPVSPKSSFSSKTGTKLPVGDKTTIEELKLSNTQLKLLVNQLVDMLEEEKKQNEDLRNEIKCLKESLTSNDRDRDTKSLPIYLDDSLDTPKLLYWIGKKNTHTNWTKCLLTTTFHLFSTMLFLFMFPTPLKFLFAIHWPAQCTNLSLSPSLNAIDHFVV